MQYKGIKKKTLVFIRMSTALVVKGQNVHFLFVLLQFICLSFFPVSVLSVFIPVLHLHAPLCPLGLARLMRPFARKVTPF
jgi:hypothetical protein